MGEAFAGRRIPIDCGCPVKEKKEKAYRETTRILGTLQHTEIEGGEGRERVTRLRLLHEWTRVAGETRGTQEKKKETRAFWSIAASDVCVLPRVQQYWVAFSTPQVSLQNRLYCRR